MITLLILLICSMIANSYKVISFSKTNAYQHESIDAANALIRVICEANNWTYYHTNNSSALFSNLTYMLNEIDLVIFSSTSGNDILTSNEKQNFEQWWKNHSNPGFIGIHSAAYTEYHWPFYHEIIGSYFLNHSVKCIHSAPQKATLTYYNPFWSNDTIGYEYYYHEEWYNFHSNVIDKNNELPINEKYMILGKVNESEYIGGTMGNDHPLIWARHYLGGKTYYTAQGHYDTFFDTEPSSIFYLVLQNAMKWCLNIINNDDELLIDLKGGISPNITLPEDDVGSCVDQTDKSGLSNNEIIIISVVAAVIGILIVVMFIIYCKRKQKTNASEKYENIDNVEATEYGTTGQ